MPEESMFRRYGVNPVIKALDIINRPYNSIMGGVQGIATGEPALDLMLKGLSGEENYSVGTVMTEGFGMDPESKLVKWGGLAGDVLNPLDPLNYVGLGLTKAGKLSKIAKGADVMKDIGAGVKRLDRVSAASKGLWNPITFMGKGVLPKVLAEPTAKGAQRLAEGITDSEVYQKFRRSFGGMSGLEKEAPKFSQWIRGNRFLRNEELDVLNREMEDLATRYGKDTLNEVRDIGEKAGLLQTEMKEWQKVLDEVHGLNPLHQAPDATPRIFENFMGMGKTVSIADPSTPTMIVNRMADLLKANDDLMKGIRPELKHPLEEFWAMKDKVENLYLSRGLRYDDAAEAPFINYFKHFLDEKFAVREELLDVKSSLLKSLFMGKAPKTAKAAKKALKKDPLAIGGKGFDQLRYRKNPNITIAEANKLYEAGEFPVKFEADAMKGMNAMIGDAERFAHAFDAHEFVAKEAGITMDQWSKLDPIKQMEYTRLVDEAKPGEFFIPEWLIAKEKNPFKDVMVPVAYKELMKANNLAFDDFTTNEGFQAALNLMEKIRNWWSAWTLAVIPGTHVRNIASDVMLARNGGLNIATPQGFKMYEASIGLAAYTRRIPLAGNAQLRETPKALDDIVATLNQRFPDAKITRDSLIRTMRAEEILGAKSAGSRIGLDDLGSKGAKKSYVPLGKPKDNALIEYGFDTMGRGSDLGRGALFFHGLMEATQAPGAKWEDAVEWASNKVRRYLFDYNDLTQFERKVMKNLAPFYAFSSKNIPMQLETLATEPGRIAYLSRLYNGQWAENQDLEPEDLPKWMADQLGMPFKRMKDANGIETVGLWVPRGWVPHTELNEMASLIRGETTLDKASFFIEKLNPMLKEPLEQIMNRDTYTGREIENGNIASVFGIPMPAPVAHIIRNIRLINEIDKLNPGGMFTKLGRQRGWWTDQRPHRQEDIEAEGTAPRMWELLTGAKTYTASQLNEINKKMMNLRYKASNELGQARRSLRDGQTREAQKHMGRRVDYAEQMKALGSRRSEVLANITKDRMAEAARLVETDRFKNGRRIQP